MKAEIITIGDELLIGQVINTNQAFIAERLNTAGIGIAAMTTVGDDRTAILAAFHEAWSRVDVVIATGGLGPTHDDITRDAACEFFHCGLVPNPDVRRHIESLMARRNRKWSQALEGQTRVPEKARVLENPLGTAPGLLFDDGPKSFILLPGVPYEMEAIVEASVVPLLRSRSGQAAIRHRTLRTTGISESLLAQKLGNIDEFVQGATLAFLPSPYGVRLRISVEAGDESAANTIIQRVEQRILARAGEYVYGGEDDELEKVLGKLLTERNLTIAVAESCTGGLIADRITDVSGSSAYFERGVVAYSNASKIAMLGVPAEVIREHGAVSRIVAEAMADGIRRVAGTTIGVSTTGIAGPTGGTIEKPVGLVWIGVSDPRGTVALRFNFGEPRIVVKQRASQAALELVRRRLLKLDSGGE